VKSVHVHEYMCVVSIQKESASLRTDERVRAMVLKVNTHTHTHTHVGRERKKHPGMQKKKTYMIF
jgi:hypothetical protein